MRTSQPKLAHVALATAWIAGPILLLMFALGGCASSLESKAYDAHLGYNAGVSAVIVARKAGKIDDSAYTAIYKVILAGKDALDELDKRRASIKAIQASEAMSEAAKAKAIADQENYVGALLASLEKITVDLAGQTDSAWAGKAK